MTPAQRASLNLLAVMVCMFAAGYFAAEGDSLVAAVEATFAMLNAFIVWAWLER